MFLSFVAQFNGRIASKVTEWFQRLSVTSGLQDDDFYSYTIKCLQDGNNKEEIIKFVNSLDVDVENLLVIPPPTLDTLPDIFSEEQKHWAKGLKDEIYTLHPVYGENGELIRNEIFDIRQEESQGTRKLIAMAGPLHEALKYGYVLFIDEIDARLHTYMTTAIVKLFNSRHTNPHGAQLIFVTHDTNLLDNTLLRRDQIWFAEKDKQGATRLVSLSEYRERNNADFEQRYLGGRYGGVPSLGQLDAALGAAHG